MSLSQISPCVNTLSMLGSTFTQTMQLLQYFNTLAGRLVGGVAGGAAGGVAGGVAGREAGGVADGVAGGIAGGCWWVLVGQLVGQLMGQLVKQLGSLTKIKQISGKTLQQTLLKHQLEYSELPCKQHSHYCRTQAVVKRTTRPLKMMWLQTPKTSPSSEYQVQMYSCKRATIKKLEIQNTFSTLQSPILHIQNHIIF